MGLIFNIQLPFCQNKRDDLFYVDFNDLIKFIIKDLSNNFNFINVNLYCYLYVNKNIEMIQ